MVDRESPETHSSLPSSCPTPTRLQPMKSPHFVQQTLGKLRGDSSRIEQNVRNRALPHGAYPQTDMPTIDAESLSPVRSPGGHNRPRVESEPMRTPRAPLAPDPFVGECRQRLWSDTASTTGSRLSGETARPSSKAEKRKSEKREGPTEAHLEPLSKTPPVLLPAAKGSATHADSPDLPVIATDTMLTGRPPQLEAFRSTTSDSSPGGHPGRLATNDSSPGGPPGCWPAWSQDFTGRPWILADMERWRGAFHEEIHQCVELIQASLNESKISTLVDEFAEWRRSEKHLRDHAEELLKVNASLRQTQLDWFAAGSVDSIIEAAVTKASEATAEKYHNRSQHSADAVEERLRLLESSVTKVDRRTSSLFGEEIDRAGSGESNMFVRSIEKASRASVQEVSTIFEDRFNSFKEATDQRSAHFEGHVSEALAEISEALEDFSPRVGGGRASMKSEWFDTNAKRASGWSQKPSSAPDKTIVAMPDLDIEETLKAFTELSNVTKRVNIDMGEQMTAIKSELFEENKCNIEREVTRQVDERSSKFRATLKRGESSIGLRNEIADLTSSVQEQVATASRHRKTVGIQSNEMFALLSDQNIKFDERLERATAGFKEIQSNLMRDCDEWQHRFLESQLKYVQTRAEYDSTKIERDMLLKKVPSLEIQVQQASSRSGVDIINKIKEIERHGNVAVNLKTGDVDLIKQLDFIPRSTKQAPTAQFADMRIATSVIDDVVAVQKLFMVNMIVEGHTRGTDAAFFKSLADNRADLIKTHLISSGVDERFISAIGLPGPRGVNRACVIIHLEIFPGLR